MLGSIFQILLTEQGIPTEDAECNLMGVINVRTYSHKTKKNVKCLHHSKGSKEHLH